MSTGIIVQARMGATRMPGKMVQPFCRGRALLAFLLDRIRTDLPDVPIVLATSDSPADDLLADIGEQCGARVFRGSEVNVLERFIGAAEQHGFERIIRVCADNPLLDTDALAQQVRAFGASGADYWSYCLGDGTPVIRTHYGFWGEGVRLSALRAALRDAGDIRHREHVTSYIYTHPGEFRIHCEPVDPLVEQAAGVRLTVDTPADFALAAEVCDALGEEGIPLTSRAICGFVIQRPDWLKRMKQESKNNEK